MAELLTLSSLLALVALAALEIVLGVDNLVFIAILTGRLPPEKRDLGRKLGLSMAAFGRIALLLAASWVVTLEQSTLLSVGEWKLSIRDLILIAGGLFLLAKATWEIHGTLEGGDYHDEGNSGSSKTVSVASVIGQILLLDLVFSIDSVLTAVGWSNLKNSHRRQFRLPASPGLRWRSWPRPCSVPWPSWSGSFRPFRDSSKAIRP